MRSRRLFSLPARITLFLLMVLFPVIIGFAIVSTNRDSNVIKQDRIAQCETLALIGAVTVGQILEKAIEEDGFSIETLFNDTYIPIPDSSPPRYQTAYDGSKLSVIFFDVDGFKQINDRYGHRTGDQVLVQVVGRISTMLRPNDILARYGGDEFVILIPGTSQVQAREAAERIREHVSNSVLEVDGKRLKITLSIGIATLNRSASESLEKAADRLLSEADERLYQAKRRGRNCVV